MALKCLHVLVTLAQGWYCFQRKSNSVQEDHQSATVPDLLLIMHWYIKAWDWLFPLCPQLWLWADGLVLLCTWWISQFWCFFMDTYLVGQLMQASGATVLPEARAVPDITMGFRGWSLQAWTSYVWKNPILLHALILAQMNHFQPPPTFAKLFYFSLAWITWLVLQKL